MRFLIPHFSFLLWFSLVHLSPLALSFLLPFFSSFLLFLSPFPYPQPHPLRMCRGHIRLTIILNKHLHVSPPPCMGHFHYRHSNTDSQAWAGKVNHLERLSISRNSIRKEKNTAIQSGDFHYQFPGSAAPPTEGKADPDPHSG